jgi:uncharacterized cupredoxin-like copper-binding protein
MKVQRVRGARRLQVAAVTVLAGAAIALHGSFESRLPWVAAGLSSSLVAQQPAIDWSRAIEMTVLLVEYRFAGAPLVFKSGTAYRLRLENSGAEFHDFTSPEFFKAVTLRHADVLAPHVDRVIVAPGEHKTIEIYVREPGRYALICADHDWAGMKGEIVVE